MPATPSGSLAVRRSPVGVAGPAGCALAAGPGSGRTGRAACGVRGLPWTGMGRRHVRFPAASNGYRRCRVLLRYYQGRVLARARVGFLRPGLASRSGTSEPRDVCPAAGSLRVEIRRTGQALLRRMVMALMLPSIDQYGGLRTRTRFMISYRINGYDVVMIFGNIVHP